MKTSEKTPLEAYSETTGTRYPSWEALVDAESNGYVVVAIISDGKQTWPWVNGPYQSKREATNARNRLRSKMNKEATMHPQTSFKLFVRPAWRDPR